MPNIQQGRSRTAAVLRKLAADEVLLGQAKDRALSQPVTEYLKPNKPGSRTLAPYTLGAKRTKCKISWGTVQDALYHVDNEDRGKGTCFIPEALALESRGYESRIAPWRFRIWGNRLYYENDSKLRSRPVLQVVERGGDYCIEWLIDAGEQWLVYKRAIAFLGLELRDVRDFSKVTTDRRALFDVRTTKDRDVQRKAARKARNAKRPTKRERLAMRQAKNDAGQPRKTFRL